MIPDTEIIRENLTPAQVIALVSGERARGNRVHVERKHSQLVEIQIFHPPQPQQGRFVLDGDILRTKA